MSDPIDQTCPQCGQSLDLPANAKERLMVFDEILERLEICRDPNAGKRGEEAMREILKWVDQMRESADE